MSQNRLSNKRKLQKSGPLRSPPKLIIKRQLLLCVDKLLNVISRRQRDLRNTAIEVRKQIQSLTTDPQNGDEFWLIFQMCCESQVPHIVEISLYSIEKLMAASILTGSTQNKNGKPLIDTIVFTICNCCAIESEKVQLEIVKAILTLGTSSSCEVHGQSLLMCLRACYNIFLSTKNMDVQNSSKAALTQIVCSVFQRMEKISVLSQKKQLLKNQKSESHLMSRSIVVALANDISMKHKYDIIKQYKSSSSSSSSSSAAAASTVTSSNGSSSASDDDNKDDKKIDNDKNKSDQKDNDDNKNDKKDDQNDNQDDNQDDNDDNVDNADDANDADPNSNDPNDVKPDQDIDDPQNKDDKPIDDNDPQDKIKSQPQPQPQKPIKVIPPKPPKNLKTITRGKFGWCVLCTSPASHYCIQTRDPVCSLDCKIANLRNSIFELRRINGSLPISVIESNESIIRLELAYKSTILTNDGHLLFRALCRQAHKTLPTDNIIKNKSSGWLESFKIPRIFDPHSSMKPLALKSKVLSLELLRLVFSNTGNTFKSSHRFIDAVRECFVPVVTENAVSTVENIFSLAINMFCLLIEQYRKYLKNEIGVLLCTVFLHIAESPHSNFKQKKMALTVFNKIVRDPQVLIGIFLNYDCGHQHDNIFKRIIDLLEKICSVKQTQYVNQSWSPQLVENVELRRLAIEILVNIIRYANEWVVKANKANAKAYDEKYLNKDIPINVIDDVNIDDLKDKDNDDDDDNDHLKQYEKKKKMQQYILNGASKFNEKPKDGIQYLIDNDIITNSVEDIVSFLKTTPSLNKTKIGDYLGGAKPFNISVMHSFVSSIDFHNMPLDTGLRKLCKHFKLPGEAAQIDRIMQKYAEKYCIQNVDVFKEADDAYILSYAIIMLNVALHHPQIKKRMTKDQFGKNNLLAVNDKGLLPLMHEIYDRIALEEIVLDNKHRDQKGNLKAKESAFAGFAWMNGLYNNNQYKSQQNGTKYLREREDILKNVNDKVSQHQRSAVGSKTGEKRRSYNTFHEPQINDVNALQPMFDICWLASLATFSVLLEDPSAETLLQYYQQSYYDSNKLKHNNKNNKNNNDKDINKYSADQLIGLCLNGYRYGIKFASNLGMDVEAESYVNSLASLTLLGTDKIMEQKNIEAIKTLLKIADEEGNILRKSWVQILKCVGELDVLHLMKSNAIPEANHFLHDKNKKQIYGNNNKQIDNNYKKQTDTKNKKNNNNKNDGSSNVVTTMYQLNLARKKATLGGDNIMRYHIGDQHLASNVYAVTSQIDQSMIDKIYQDSVKLGNEGIIHFAVGLSCVSAMELDNPLNPRVFSLRKIVEVSHDNINLRIPLVWQRIWNVLSPHFVKAGCHLNTNIGAYAINSLRQLALLFFEKEELANFQFQNKFLLPFQHIMEKTKSQEIRLLIIECIFRIVKARFNNVKSGWKTVFSCLGIAAKDPHEILASSTYKITEQILKDYFPLLKLVEDDNDDDDNDDDNDDNDDNADNDDTKDDDQSTAPQILAAETLDECVNCLVSFSGNIWTDISLKAINNLVLCAQHLYDLDHSIKQRVDDDNIIDNKFNPQKESPMIKAWFLCLTGLSRLIFDNRIEVRGKSLEAMFQILQQHGAGFSSQMWELIFRGILLPIFDDIYHNQIQKHSSIMSPSNQQIIHQLDTSWLETTGITALLQLIQLFKLFFLNCRFILDKIALLLQSGINQLNEKTAKVSIKCWKILIDGISDYLTTNEWDIILNSLSKSLHNTLPFSFSNKFNQKCNEYQQYQKIQIQKSPNNNFENQHQRYPIPKYNINVTSVQTMIHLIILDQIFNITINYAIKINQKQMNMIIKSFENSYTFARRFNLNTNFRNFLWNSSHSNSPHSPHSIQSDINSNPPDLYYQEARSSSFILEILLTLCSNYIPSQILKINMNKDIKNKLFKIHKINYINKLYLFCNKLVTQYCNDAKIETFKNITSTSINITKVKYSHLPPTSPAPSLPKIQTQQVIKGGSPNTKSSSSNSNSSSSSSAREYTSRRLAQQKQKQLNNNINASFISNNEKGLRWKTGVIVTLLDSILDSKLWKDLNEQQKFILNLYDYLILCIAIDNREVRQRISKLFGGIIKVMLMKQYKFDDNNKNNNDDDQKLNNNDIDIIINDDCNRIKDDDKLEIDTSRIVAV